VRPPFQPPVQSTSSGRVLRKLMAPIIRRGSIGLVLGNALVARCRGDGRNSYLPVACIERRHGRIVYAGNFFEISRFFPRSVSLGSHIRHTKTP